VSILAAGILPLATAYAICEAFGFESGLDQKFADAPIFNGLLTFFVFVPAAVAVIPRLPLVKVMLLSQDVNGILLPIILIYVLKIVNDRSVMGDHVNGPVFNTLAWAFSAALIALTVVLVVSTLPLGLKL
jgi:Mn2+/Fe2+ NRAMP family transporter